MPSIRSVTLTATDATFLSHRGSSVLTYSTLPAAQNTIAKAETWINAWLAVNVTACQTRAHVFQRTPLTLTVGTFDFGLSIPASWWQD